MKKKWKKPVANLLTRQELAEGIKVAADSPFILVGTLSIQWPKF